MTDQKTEKICNLLAASKAVIADCALGNGGIVAANTTKSYYPDKAKNYFYIWPRDAAFACIASGLVGLGHIREPFFHWCLHHAEGFANTGLFYEKYYPNGLKALPRFQPDQTGAVLYAAWHYLNNGGTNKSECHELIEKAANGLCKVWDKDHFTINTNDLWEERLCFPDLKENFSYSLASCIAGLRRAAEILPNEIWLTKAAEMKAQLDKHCTGFFMRSYGQIPDKRIDASMLGLVYPFGIYDENDPRMIATATEIETKLAINGGIHRYEHDEYDGWMCDGAQRNKGAGAWPLLNFWMSIYCSKKGDTQKALQYYDWVLDRIGNSGLIPEQIFENELQVSVSPLLWSHIMFIVASKELNYI